MIGLGGLLSGLQAKALMALGLAATTLTGAGAATGSLPGPAQDAVAGVVNAVSPLDIPTSDEGGDLVAGVKIGGGPEASAHVDANADAGAASIDAGGSASTGAGSGATANGSASAGGTTPLTPPGLPSVPGVPDLPSIPGLPDVLGNLPIEVPDCASSIIDPASGKLLVAPNQLAAKVLDCVKSMVPAGTIPSSISQCLTSVLNSLQGVLGGGVPSGVPSINLSSCAPVDVSPCVSSILSSVGTNPLAIVSNLGSLSNLTNLFNVDDLTGCVPVNATQCVSSILGAFTSGNVTNIDLSACLPTSVTGRA